MTRPRANPAAWGFTPAPQMPEQQVRNCRACGRRVPHSGPTCLACMARATARYLEITHNDAAREGFLARWRAEGFRPGIEPGDPLLDHEFWATCWTDMELGHAAQRNGDDMSFLDTIQRGRRPRPRICCCYGTHGVGKSTWAAGAPSPIFIACEDGLADIDCDSFPGVQSSLAAVTNCIETLYVEEHPFKTVVVDSLTGLEPLIWRAVCEAEGVPSIEKIGYGKGYQFAVEAWSGLMAGLQALREHRGMHVVLLGHAQVEKFADPMGESYDRMVPQLDKRARAFVLQQCDEVFYAFVEQHTREEDAGFNKKRAIAVGTGRRYLACTRAPAHEAKNRLGIPHNQIDMTWAAYAEFQPPANQANPQKETASNG